MPPPPLPPPNPPAPRRPYRVLPQGVPPQPPRRQLPQARPDPQPYKVLPPELTPSSGRQTPKYPPPPPVPKRPYKVLPPELPFELNMPAGKPRKRQNLLDMLGGDFLEGLLSRRGRAPTRPGRAADVPAKDPGTSLHNAAKLLEQAAGRGGRGGRDFIGDTAGRLAGKARFYGDLMQASGGDQRAMGRVAAQSVNSLAAGLQGFGKNLGAGAGQMAEGGYRFMASDRFGDMGAGMMDFFGGSAKMMGPLGKPIEKLFEFGKATFEAIEAFRKLNDTVLESNLRFGEFSGSMAAVRADQEVENIKLSILRGERRAESAAELAKSRMEMERHLAAIEDSLANMKNYMLSKLNAMVVAVLKWLKVEPGGDGPGDGYHETFRELLESFDEAGDRPARLR